MLTVTWLGHSTVALDVAGVRLLTDPLLRRHAGLLRRRGDAPQRSSWAGAAAVLLSHLHHDHAELSSLRLLPGVPVLTAPANAAWLDRKGLRGVGLAPTQWYEVDAGVQVRLVRAEHGHRPMPHRPNAANGHLVRAEGRRIWVAGDTSGYPELDDLPQLAGGPIDLALVPIAGWGPRLGPGHLDAEQAAEVCGRIGVRYALPVHFGSLHPPGRRDLGYLDRPAGAFARALAERAPGCHLLTGVPGQPLPVPA